MGISVEDVKAYVTFIKSTVGITHEDELIKAVVALTDKVHPLALGNVERFLTQSRMIARKILRTHMSETEEHTMEEIIERTQISQSTSRPFLIKNGVMTCSNITTYSAAAALGPDAKGVRAGNLIFTAGQVALDPVTGQAVPGGITEQTTRVFENLKAILEAGGSSLGQVVKANSFPEGHERFRSHECGLRIVLWKRQRNPPRALYG